MNPHPCSEQVLLREAEKSGCLCAKSKGLLLHLWAAVTPWGSEGLLPSALPTALTSMQLKELLYLISLFLAQEKEKLMRTEEADPWWREDGEDVDVQLWVGKKGLEAQGLLSLSVHMMEKQKSLSCSWAF